jgi:HEAT repeat protein
MWQLAAQKDQRCVEPILQILKNAPANYFEAQYGPEHGISALGAVGSRVAVSGLIELLNSDLSRFTAYDRKGWQRLIAAQLIFATGESFGTDAAAWKKWYEKSMK